MITENLSGTIFPVLTYFKKTSEYLAGIDLGSADPLDKKVNALINDEAAYERASQALRRRFSRGASEVEGVDRGGRGTKIKRERVGGKYKYFILGTNNEWTSPEERIWVVGMYSLWQDSRKAS